MPRPQISRRQFLFYSGGALVLTGCGATQDRGAPGSSTPPATRPRVASNDPLVVAAEQNRRGGDVVKASLTAQPFAFDLAGRVANTWAFNDQVGGPLLRAKVGQELEVTLNNRLPEPTTIHWHGLALRNDMDGVRDLTQPAIAPNTEFTYRFKLAHSGTYWFHPHTGLQLDRGLYAPLIIDDPSEPGDYGAEIILVLDDWLDGLGSSPDDVLRGLKSMDMGGSGGMGGPGTTSGPANSGGGGGMNHSGMDMGAARVRQVSFRGTHGTSVPAKDDSRGRALMGAFQSQALGGDAGDVSYPLHLINGKPSADRSTFDVPRGRVRVRIINAGSDTAYRFAIGGHKLQVTHTDGFATLPVEVDAIMIGMGERYDVIVDAQSGVWPIVAIAEGKSAMTSALMRTTDSAVSAAPPSDTQPEQLRGRLLNYSDLRPGPAVNLGEFKPDTTIEVDLTGNMAAYSWGINGAALGTGRPIEIVPGQRVRLNINNRTMMWHPVHLHGHTFSLATAGGGPRKDTVNVLPGATQSVDFVADNPGQWMMHCHNTYHLEAGMATEVVYVKG